MHRIAWWFGLTDPNSPTYLFWSGVGGFLRDIFSMAAALHIAEHLRRRRDG